VLFSALLFLAFGFVFFCCFVCNLDIYLCIFLLIDGYGLGNNSFFPCVCIVPIV
jgi:hypothetical protein